jgi:hypothetical protein
MARHFRATRLLVLSMLTGVVLGACAPASDTPGSGDGATGGGDEAVLTDGDHLGLLRLVDLDQGVILVDLVTWVDDDNEPNGFRIDDPDDEVWEGRLAADVAASVIDCTQACEPMAVDLAAIANGDVRPFNGEYALFDVAVRDGQVTSVEERYTP